MQSQSDKIHAIAMSYITCLSCCSKTDCHNCTKYYKVSSSYNALSQEEQLEVDNVILSMLLAISIYKQLNKPRQLFSIISELLLWAGVLIILLSLIINC